MDYPRRATTYKHPPIIMNKCFDPKPLPKPPVEIEHPDPYIKGKHIDVLTTYGSEYPQDWFHDHNLQMEFVGKVLTIDNNTICVNTRFKDDRGKWVYYEISITVTCASDFFTFFHKMKAAKCCAVLEIIDEKCVYREF